VTPHDLVNLGERLLRDADGDGFPDSLVAPIWIARGSRPSDVDAGVVAAAELLAHLSDRALHLELDIRDWDVANCGFCIAQRPQPAITLQNGVALDVATDTFTLAARSPGALRQALRSLLGQPQRRRSVDPTAGHNGTMLGLGALQHGDDGVSGATPFSGPRDHPQRFSGGFAAAGGVAVALDVAVRLALTGVQTAGPLGAHAACAAFRTGIDSQLAGGSWQLRRQPGAPFRAELVGADRQALAAACHWFAHSALATPDGQRFDDIEDALTSFVRAANRLGRVAALASACAEQRTGVSVPRRATLMAPPADAPRLLGVAVSDSARDGVRRQFDVEVPWEGARLLDATRRLMRDAPPAAAEGNYVLEAFASETRAIRAELHADLEAALRATGSSATVLPVRHAFRPALHWLIEEVAAAAPMDATRLHVLVGRQSTAFGPADRWLRELYPVAEVIEQQHATLRVEFDLADTEVETPTYTATLFDAVGSVLLQRSLTPLVSRDPHPAGGDALVVSAGVRLLRDGHDVAQAVVRSDAEVFWRWLQDDVLPAVVAELDTADTPLLHEISVIASLSEPDERFTIDHETDSVTEVLHEEVYFGVLEAFDRAFDSPKQRHLSPGRILPFFHVAERQPMRATVTVRARGSDRLALELADGTWHDVPPCDANVLVERVTGRASRVVALQLRLAGEGASEAASRLRWAATRGLEGVLPEGVAITLVHPDGRAERLPGQGAERTTIDALPERPLHPREVVRHALAWRAARPALRVATPRESALGQPLVVVEVVDAERPALSRARAAAWRPTLLVSARQHANEATSTQAVWAWCERWLADPALWRRANLVVHPLENPDGARLHAACCSLAPNHMHHAARYTAFGADLQTNPRVRGEIIAESLMRHDAARRWRPVAHLNDHGYPAHAWIRSLTGFVPQGFANWSLPTGHLTILASHAADALEAAALRTHLCGAVEAALSTDGDVVQHTAAQIARGQRYRSSATTPFTFHGGLPFWIEHRPYEASTANVSELVPNGPDARGPFMPLTPLVTLITEVPDETVDGAFWDRCVRTHERVDDAVARALLGWLEGQG